MVIGKIDHSWSLFLGGANWGIGVLFFFFFFFFFFSILFTPNPS